ncbi:MAG: RluA family pseudouridine synthase [Verrucomicrobia bacterium]|jgi:23S rRNA pseudouridine1911/1915/1917 synthase|nr:RluA family pseudouridine synthase [Verrucomicrobiota bacterium]
MTSPDAGTPRTERLTIEATVPRSRLDNYLHARFPCVSRSTLQRLIREGHVTVNGAPVKPTHPPRAGDEVRITWPPPRPTEIVPREIPLTVLYEDEQLLVLNKPPGLVVHPAAGNEDHTLVNALLHHCAGRLSGVGGVIRPGIVHRLDQFTSGLMVVAKDDATHMGLSYQFSRRQVEKLYHAVVCGGVEPPTGEIEAPIARHPNHRKVMTVTEGGRPAHTSYRVMERLREATLVEARLHTGRTHQVRVHFKFIGFPLVGDLVYGRKQNARLKELTGVEAPRQMLHARLLAFDHPRSGERLSFEAPWPEDFAAVVRALRSG